MSKFYIRAHCPFPGNFRFLFCFDFWACRRGSASRRISGVGLSARSQGLTTGPAIGCSGFICRRFACGRLAGAAPLPAAPIPHAKHVGAKIFSPDTETQIPNKSFLPHPLQIGIFIEKRYGAKHFSPDTETQIPNKSPLHALTDRILIAKNGRGETFFARCPNFQQIVPSPIQICIYT